MIHVWLRAQHSPLAVWHEDLQHWQSVEGWQQLQERYGSYKANGKNAVCLYFPSSHVLQVDTELNTAQLKQLGNSGKQYLFEEMSLTPVEQLAVRQISHAERYQLYALAQSDIDSWEQSAQLAGMSLIALLPDFLLLPAPTEQAGQQITLYQDEQTTLLRQSAWQGMAVSYLPLIFERFPHLSEVSLLPPIAAMEQQDELDARSDWFARTAELIADHQLLLTPLSASPVPLENPERHALNFFVKSADSQLSPYLRVAMMVALAALVLQIATDGVQWYQYQQAATATKAEIANQYNSWFANEPLSSRNKLQIQLQPKLRHDSQAPASHMATLARLSPLIKQSSLHAQALVMQPSALSFTLIAPDRGSLDQFTSTLVAQGIDAKLAQVNSTEQGQFSGQITVAVAESADLQAATATS
ncbi:type II secretion system protein GspL [Psychrobacter celer]|uniref:type II secretion system protein GspL n=1 Tax=Psychrobacter celer TaxID=306572 RepID=UPI003FD4DC3C